MPSIDILIVDDHLVVREGLKRILADTPEIRVAGEAGSVPEALSLLRSRGFHLLLLDISLPGRTGVELLKQIRDEFAQLRVLVLSAYTEDQYALRVLKEGAHGFLNKESAAELLVSAIRKVAAGGKYISPELAERLADQLGGHGEAAPHELLSEREFVVLRLIAAGKSLNDIATDLRLSPKTISTYRSRIVEKIGLRSNAELTRYAIEKGLV
jgi:two-component system, NarL family, invasion response regulator UvrY